MSDNKPLHDSINEQIIRVFKSAAGMSYSDAAREFERFEHAIAQRWPQEWDRDNLKREIAYSLFHKAIHDENDLDLAKEAFERCEELRYVHRSHRCDRVEIMAMFMDHHGEKEAALALIERVKGDLVRKYKGEFDLESKMAALDTLFGKIKSGDLNVF